MRACTLVFALLVACRSGAPLAPDPSAGGPLYGASQLDPGPAESEEGSGDTGGADGESGEDGDSAEPTCDEEGEACEVYEDGLSSCCISRHTCFPEGCYYSLPG